MKKLLLVPMFAVGLISKSNAQFRGPYAPSNWNFNSQGTQSTMTVAPDASSITFNIPQAGEFHYTITMPLSGQVQFNYDITGDYSWFAMVDALHGKYYIANTPSGTLTSTSDYSAPMAGYTLEISGGANFNGPVTATISSFMAPGVPLPVKLAYFAGTSTPSGNELHWYTASEQAVSSFDVERSRDGIDFAPVGKVAARNQSGNYSFQDPAVTTDLAYYRLKVVNTDGSAEYSNILSIRPNTGKECSLVAHPNPAKDVINLEVRNGSEGGRVALSDVTGKVVLQQAVAASASLNIQGLPAGLYLLKYQDAHHTQTKQVQVATR